MKTIGIAGVGWVLGATLATLATARPTRADGDASYLIGPLLGVSWGGKHVRQPSLLIGLEGGTSLHPFLPVNAGVSYRRHEAFLYGELDPWLYLGATIGVGYGTTSGAQPVLGVWSPVGCRNSGPEGSGRVAMTLTVGYRWTGAHELYLAPKVGTLWGGAGCP